MSPDKRMQTGDSETGAADARHYISLINSNLAGKPNYDRE